LIDLHTHSTASDGTDTPSELVARASALGLEAIALTDHDTVEGVAEAIAAGKEIGVEVVSGIELSIEDGPDRRFHLLSYFFDPHDQRLGDILLRVRQWRDDRNTLIIGRAQAAGIDLTIDDVRAEAGPEAHVLGRPHFAAALVKKGLATSIQDAFDKYLAAGRPLNEPKPSLSSKQAAELIHGAGGVTVFAHPGLVRWADFGHLKHYLSELKQEDAIDGLECYYPRHSADQNKNYLEIADELGLLVTGGSDYHGNNKPDIRLGSVWQDRALPATLLGSLRAASVRRSSANQAAA
jgi:3',5'-nucleoside bisphosphate phosphatase